jgi:tRNA pseudouridine38-40 synthase
MPTYKLSLAYRGTAYAGWQRQENAVTVQEILEDALAGVLGEAVAVVGASRTDAGVHARGQTVHLRLAREVERGALVFGVNHRLPEDVRVLDAQRADDRFHARFAALGKEYRYRCIAAEVLSPFDAPFALRVERDLDRAALAAATATLVGRHDFTAFALAGGAHQDPVRTVTHAGWEARGAELDLVILGDGFLRGMVRGIAGTLLEIACGKRPASDVGRLLGGLPRGEAGPTAPAHGLCLERVFYDATGALAATESSSSLC